MYDHDDASRGVHLSVPGAAGRADLVKVCAWGFFILGSLTKVKSKASRTLRSDGSDKSPPPPPHPTWTMRFGWLVGWLVLPFVSVCSPAYAHAHAHARRPVRSIGRAGEVALGSPRGLLTEGKPMSLSTPSAPHHPPIVPSAVDDGDDEER